MCILLLVLTVTVFLDATSALSLATPEPVCGPNEMPGCNNDCQLTCKNRMTGYQEYCTDTEDCPETICICKPAHYLHDDGRCVLAYDCSPPQCKEGEVYCPCGTSRMETCDERGNTCQSKPLRCVEGCFCPEGYYLNSNSTCVPEHECPPRTCDGPNEYFDECPSKPDQNCAEIGLLGPTETFCCEPECRCIDGYYRNIEGYCIPEDQCNSDAVNSAIGWLHESESSSLVESDNSYSLVSYSQL